MNDESDLVAHRIDARLAVPEPPSDVVARSRLFHMLDAGIAHPLTLVCGPAGSGKTVLVSSWARVRSEQSPAWLSLDADDLADGSIWSLIAQALAPQFGTQVPEPHDGSRAFLAELASKLCALGNRVVLVLDCDVSPPLQVAHVLDTLLRRSCAKLRLILITRTEPPLPLHRYRLTGSIMEIRGSELAFRDEEAGALLTSAGVHLPAAVRDDVMGHTLGWASGLRFAALKLAASKDPDPAIGALNGTQGPVSEYLRAEVLDRQPRRIRELLLRTCVVDVLVPGLAEALAGPSAPRELASLTRADVFLEETRPGRYRYHPLFRQLLRTQLADEMPLVRTQVHRLAGAWLARHGAVETAVSHAVAAAAWEEACRYVVDGLAVGQLLTEDPEGPLHVALAAIPQHVPGSDAPLVRSALSGRQAAGPLPEDLTEEGAEQEHAPRQLAQTLLALRDGVAAGQARQVLSVAANGFRLIDLLQIENSHPETVLLLRWAQGAAHLQAGRLTDAVEAFSLGTRTAAPVSAWPSVECLSELALIAACRGHLRRATRFATRALDTGSRAVGGAASTPATVAEVALCVVAVETCAFSDAKRYAGRARASGTRHGPLPAVMLTVASARLRRARGEAADAVSILASAAALVPRPPAWMHDLLLTEKAISDLACGDPDRAAQTLADLTDRKAFGAALTIARVNLARGRASSVPLPAPDPLTAALSDRAEYELLEVARTAQEGMENDSRKHLEQALALAAPEALRRPFYEAPTKVRRLLRQDESLAARHPWLHRDTSLASNTSGEGPPTPVSPDSPTAHTPFAPLTEKEREVLTHLAEFLTTEEIAQSMFISVNTVRTHIRNILRKLVVARRNDAVRKARSLRLIAG